MALAHGLWDPRSLTRDRTCVPCRERVQSTRLPGNSRKQLEAQWKQLLWGLALVRGLALQPLTSRGQGLRINRRELGEAAVLLPAQPLPLSAQCQGKTFPSIHLWTRLLSALAGLLYASAIVAHDRRPEYLLRATPWLLTSLGRAALDLSVSTPGPGAGLPVSPLPSAPPCPPTRLVERILSQWPGWWFEA